MRSFVACLAVLTAAHAQAGERPLDVDPAVDASIAAGSFLGGGLLGLIEVDTSARWRSEPLGIDEGVKDNFSSSAAQMSDLLLWTTVLTPTLATVGTGLDAGAGEAILVYGESLGLTMLLTNAVKYLVQRPRPYNYHPSPAVRAWAEEQGADSHLSFFSGHSSFTFAAAVSGSLLFAQRRRDRAARAVMWGLTLNMAAATATLRVRAGKHFISDVVTGALVGSAVGFAVPYLHLDRPQRYSVSAAEMLAMAGGVALGVAGAALLPIDEDITVPLSGVAAGLPVAVAPMALEGGAGLMLTLAPRAREE